MITALLLILLGTLTRLAPHAPNAVPLGALALYAGVKLPRRWAILVPIATMIASDLYLDWGSARPILSVVRFSVYISMTLIVILGMVAGPNARGYTRLGLTACGSTLFFLLTNFAVWWSASETIYAHNSQGLATCFAMALPFFGNSLAADLIGVVVFFGLDHVVHEVTERFRQPNPTPILK